MIRGFMDKVQVPSGCIGAVAPHAGYVYSGLTAAYTYAAIGEASPHHITLVGPVHSGRGPPAAHTTYDTWETPLGSSPILHDMDTIRRCHLQAAAASEDDEHSLETQLPFIQYIFGHIPICPVLLSDQSYGQAVQLGQALASSVDDTIVVASSDLSHYMPYQVGYMLDSYVIDAVLDLDIKGLYRTIMEQHVSACGYGAIACTMEYCIQQGASEGKLLYRDTSATHSGDYTSVVGYASIAFY